MSEAITRADVARGAGLATLARLGALVEVVAQPIYTWLFGIATYGIYTVLWAAVNIVENIVDLSMTQALQRVVPAAREEAAHAAVRLALLVSVTPALLIAAGVTIAADPIAAVLSVAPEDRATLPTAIALFAWALPLWTFVEVATAAARARRAFGPEIRLRIFWEQVARLGFAVGLAAMGMQSLGLMIAHLLSLALTALLAARLLTRYYDWRLLIGAPIDRATRHDLIASGFSTLPSAIARRLFNDLPAIILNLMLPGTRGAEAAGLFGIARKVASVPLIVRQAFQYVLAPLATAQAAVDRAGIAPLYRFATRVSTTLVIPIAAALILLASDILSLFAPAAMAALPLLIVLVVGRAAEAAVGAATPVIEMTGHRGLPLANAIAGLTLWALLAWWLVPTMGGTGMAIAVSAGTVASAWAAAIELKLTENLGLLDGRLARGIAIALIGALLMAAIGMLADPLGARPRAAILLLLLPATLWTALRYGLDREDRLAFGGLARRLRLI